MVDVNILLPYIYITVSFIIIVLLYISYCAWRTKRTTNIIKNMVEEEIEDENQRN